MPSSGFISDIAVAALTRMGCTQGNVMLKNQNSSIVGNFIFVQRLHASAVSRSFFVLCYAVTNSEVIKIRDLCRDRLLRLYTKPLVYVYHDFSLLCLSFLSFSSSFRGRDWGAWSVERDFPSSKCNMMQQSNTLPQVMYTSVSVQCISTHGVIKY